MNPETLSHLLRQNETGVGVVLFGMAVAFGLGGMHALSPGHGKTVVAAYLVGARGTVRHALLLGAVVTFTHTASVFALGLATLFLSQTFHPDRVVPVLAVISGISIVWIGSTLLWRRLSGLRKHHSHHHHHDHPNDGHDHGHHHGHYHAEVSLSGLIALGASGGLVPCPSALVLMLSSIALRRAGLGLLLLAAFSAGLALVLMAIGVLAVYARHLLPEGKHAAQRWLRYVPVASAALIVCVGLLMTAAAAGLIGGFVG